ncbi:hypothetical protein [Hyphomicrobium sp.]|uniref:hypothetical protein n=1 Tax=Hyphomicrobium sp. TaxID=82 RepID=UPI001320F207|nr:hypothetical protein [Hyphomicrobium sp.]KAB2939412.1 MAG: hypothetical protein F9K20_16875 [Hyphomicrobium sp.]
MVAVTPSGASGKWVGRDGFVAEAAVQLDRITANIARLERELERSKATVVEMAEEANRTRRFQAFEETLKNSRDYKITDLQRCCKDLKARLDAIEGDRSTFAGLTYRSFEPVNRKLAELSTLQMDIERAEFAARRNEVLFFGALAVAAMALASHFIF